MAPYLLPPNSFWYIFERWGTLHQRAGGGGAGRGLGIFDAEDCLSVSDGGRDCLLLCTWSGTSIAAGDLPRAFLAANIDPGSHIVSQSETAVRPWLHKDEKSVTFSSRILLAELIVVCIFFHICDENFFT